MYTYRFHNRRFVMIAVSGLIVLLFSSTQTTVFSHALSGGNTAAIQKNTNPAGSGSTGAQIPKQNHIVIKFKEGSGVRLRGEKLTTTTSLDVSSVDAVLNRFNLGKLKRFFSRPEEALDSERQDALLRKGKHLPDLNLYYELDIPAGLADSDIQKILDALNTLSIVQVAYQEPAYLVGGGTDITPTTPSFVIDQGYLGAAPSGLDATYAWTQPGGKGDGVNLVDIEGGWLFDHEDLGFAPNPLLAGTNSADSSWYMHGTATMGEVIGIDNAYGITGVANHTTVHTISIINMAAADAINQAVANTNPGDVILIEFHSQGPSSGEVCTCNCHNFEYIPIEYWQANFDAIAAATAAGRIVVELGGNGSMNLDSSIYGGAFDRSIRDSGAILVAGGTSTDHAPECWSNYGGRLDLQGWGDNVATTGYGDAFNGGGDLNQYYTSTFAGSSSGSAMVTGAVLDLLGIAKANGMLLTPAQVRQIMRNTGTPQATDSRQIGPLPDLRAAIQALGINTPTPVPPTNTPTPTPLPATNTPTRTPTPLPTGGLTVQYRTLDTSATDNQIRPQFNIVNGSSNTVSLNALRFRYYYTRDTAQPMTFSCDYATVDCGNVTSQFVPISPAVTGADYYVEVGFSGVAGVLAPGTHTIVLSRINKNDWSNFNETNDYSYDPTKTNFADWNHVTLYQNGTLVWGIPPASSGSSPTIAPTFQPATNTPSPVTNTPVLPTLTPTRTPTPVSGGFQLKYRAGNISTTTNQIEPYFTLINTTSSTVPLYQFKIRYWFTRDTVRTMLYQCVYTTVGCANIYGTFVYLTTPVNGADVYLEVGFNGSAGNIAANGGSVEVQTLNHKNDWSNFTQTNDYSFDATKTSYVYWTQVTLYRNGTLVWGTEP